MCRSICHVSVALFLSYFFQNIFHIIFFSRFGELGWGREVVRRSLSNHDVSRRPKSRNFSPLDWVLWLAACCQVDQSKHWINRLIFCLSFLLSCGPCSVLDKKCTEIWPESTSPASLSFFLSLSPSLYLSTYHYFQPRFWTRTHDINLEPVTPGGASAQSLAALAR